MPGGDRPRRRTASSARARTRIARASGSRPPATGRGLRVVVGAVAGTPQFFPELCRARRRPLRRSARALRRGDRADRRRPRLGRVPPARHRRRGAARARGGRMDVIDPVDRDGREPLRRRTSSSPGMLHARILRSPVSRTHGSLAVDASAVPDGVVVLTPDDVRDLGRYGCQIAGRDACSRSTWPGTPAIPWPRSRRRPTPRGGRRRSRSIEVEYEELPRRVRRGRGCAPGRAARPRHASASRDNDAAYFGIRPQPGTNVCHRFQDPARRRRARLRRGGRRRRGDVPDGGCAARRDGAARQRWRAGRASGSRSGPARRRRSTSARTSRAIFGIAEERVRVVVPADGRLLRREDLRPPRGDRRRARAQGGPAREGACCRERRSG